MQRSGDTRNNVKIIGFSVRFYANPSALCAKKYYLMQLVAIN